MRNPRWRALAGATLVALCATTALAQAADDPQQLKVGLSKTKAGTKKKPAATGIHVTITNLVVDNPSTTETTTISFPKALAFNNAQFPTCKASQITLRKSVATCPKGSIVGHGTANAVGIAGSSRIPETLSVTAVNGPRSTLNLFVAGDTPLSIKGILVGKLLKAGGAYGYKLAVTIPPGLRMVGAGIYAPLVRFDVNVNATVTVKSGKGAKAKKHKVSYVVTTGCKAKRWNFMAAFTYDQAAPNPIGPSSSTTTAACH